MSRELHDELGQALTLLRIDLTWIASRISRFSDGEIDASLKTKIGEMESDIGKTLQIVRRITTELRPPVLDELGLADAIEWQVRDFSRRVGIRCDVSAEAVNCECKTTATAAFRTLQELLTNVARHSKASRVRVFLKEVDGALTLAVSDNGCGFELDASGTHVGFGLLGMRERAESLRGALQIESKVGVGTTVTLSIPKRSATSSDGHN
jgi:signal transduction histidine kinase